LKKIGRRMTYGKHLFSVGMSVIILMIMILQSGPQQGEDGRKAAHLPKAFEEVSFEGLRMLLNTLGEALRIYRS
jgi:hypothetical protein